MDLVALAEDPATDGPLVSLYANARGDRASASSYIEHGVGVVIAVAQRSRTDTGRKVKIEQPERVFETIAFTARSGGRHPESSAVLLEEKERELVTKARQEETPWSAIGAALGVSRQAAWERWHEVDSTAKGA